MSTREETIASKIEAEDMGRTCAFCKGRTFRRSRLKFKDVGSLLSLHYPVRCLSCSKRQNVGLDTARKAVPSTVRQIRARKEETPWDGSPWSRPRGAAAVPAPSSVNDMSAGELPAGKLASMRPIAMPDLHGVRLPHVAQMPPGDGENLA